MARTARHEQFQAWLAAGEVAGWSLEEIETQSQHQQITKCLESFKPAEKEFPKFPKMT